MRPGPILSIPNFSEGRDYHFVRALQDAASAPTVVLHTLSWDVDHNRTVVGLSGEPEALRAALLAMAFVAFERIDLRRHRGVHPRIGALDVLPLVATAPEHAAAAQRLAEDLGREIAELGQVPVFLYGDSARPGKPRELGALRKGQYEGWVGKELEGEHAPDFGPARLHEARGAVILGVRGPLTAFNVNLSLPQPGLARAIAKELRSARDRDEVLHGVMAMGVALESRGMSQVSTNITEPERTGMADVFSFVASRAGDAVAWCEVVGVVRRCDLSRAEASPHWPAMRLRLWPEQVVG
ncbi:MAG: glutamate formiminotransferase [Fimbriimonadales bacterium]